MRISKSVLGAALIAIIASPAFADGAKNGHFGGLNKGYYSNPDGMFERIDTNKDGVITRAEVKAAHDALFREIDTNNDGFITKEEQKAHRDRQAKLMHDKMKERVQKNKVPFDANGDGVVTQEEWKTGQANMQADREKHHNEMFKKFDKNGDGKITKDEFDGARVVKTNKTTTMQKTKTYNNPDTNKDGKISKAEWDAMPFPLFDIADTNKDGKITKEEAQRAMMPPRPPKGGANPPPPPPM